MNKKNVITDLFNIKYPIIQGGMVWASGWKLASAVSNSGGLGLLGSGSMYPHILREHIQKCKAATDKSFGVNVPLIYPQIDKLMEVILEEKVKIVFTSAGNPKIWTSILKKEGIKVAHVVSNLKFAQKAIDSGVDAIVAEGFEAGGHNGREETTTLALIPFIRASIKHPLIAAGGIATGQSILAMMALGADGVQIGSRFVASEEASSHLNFKQRVIDAKEGDTILTLKEIAPVRMMKNKFFEGLKNLYERSANVEHIKDYLGKGRAKKGMFMGDLNEGALEIGQISSIINGIKPVKQIMKDLVADYGKAKKALISL